jgi:hypothetical protein
VAFVGGKGKIISILRRVAVERVPETGTGMKY